MKPIDIYKLYTEIAKEYLEKGLVFAITSGSQGELIRTDLTDFVSLYRLSITRFNNDFDDHGVKITVELFPYKEGEIYYTGKGNIQLEKQFWHVTDEWFISDESCMSIIREKRGKRYTARYIRPKDFSDNPKVKKVALLYLRKQSGFSKAKPSDIQRVSKIGNRFVITTKNLKIITIRQSDRGETK